MITLNQEQQEATNVRKGFYSILAGPGSGKTQVITQRYQDLLAEGEDPEQIISLTFSNEASKNMSKRAGVGKEPTSRPSGFRTFHSFALSFVSSERFLFPFPVASFPLAVDSSLYAIQAIRAHKVNYKEFITWLSRTKRNRISPEKALEQASTSKEKDMARAYKMYEDTCHSNGVLDFDSMLIETVNLLEKNERVRMRWQYKWLQIDEAQDADGIQWRLVQLLSEAYQNVFAVGDGNQCQPGSTVVSTVEGLKRIDEIKQGQDLLVSWTKRQDRLYESGRSFKKSVQSYNGNLLTISTSGRSTKVTPGHFMWVKFDRKNPKYVVYLMWKNGMGFRVGTSKTTKQNGMAHRATQEKANKFWILDAVDSRSEAETLEEIYSIKYQIPECMFFTYNGVKRSNEQIRRVFNSVGECGGLKLLQEKGLLFEDPLAKWPNDTLQKFHGYFKISARNLIPSIMLLPTETPYKNSRIDYITREYYNGLVYSLDVDKDHTYVADGIPVGNCIYEWRSAHPDLFLNFKELFPGSKELYLGENFRSTPQITAYVKRNAPIQNGLLDRMLSNRPNGPEPFVRKFGGEYDEAFSICEDISLHDKEYVLGNNIAILSRTNQGLRAYQDFLGAKGVKYFLLGKSGFWQQKEVKKIVDAMRLLSPSFGDMPADTIADKAISDLGIMRYAENFAETDNSPLDNIRELRVVASRFKTLNGFLDHAAKMQKLSRVKKGVALSTIHASKGKEWKEVYVIQCSEGTIPHKNGDLDEEHRTFFVAKSRAADILRISYSGTPSRFLA